MGTNLELTMNYEKYHFKKNKKNYFFNRHLFKLLHLKGTLSRVATIIFNM